MATEHVGPLIQPIVEQDEELYKKVIDLSLPPATDSEENNAFTRDVDKFLEALSDASLEVTDINERLWITDAAAKWQKLLSSLNIPRSIKIHDPKRPLQPPPSPSDYYTDEEIEGLLRSAANALSRDRLNARAEILMVYLSDRQNVERLAQSPEIIKTLIGFTDLAADMENDWHTASVQFAADVFEGRIDFIRKIHPDSYYRLEREWLEDIKKLQAYKIWLGRGRGWGQREKTADYFQACDDFARALHGPTRKASEADFVFVKEYIQENYLDGEPVSLQKKRTTTLVRAKAQRLHDSGLGSSPALDWSHACDYVKAFYCKLLGAVEQRDLSKALHIFRMLTGREERYYYRPMVNMFEAIILKYFVKYT
jgi:hypothetical protein